MNGEWLPPSATCLVCSAPKYHCVSTIHKICGLHPALGVRESCH